MDRRPETRTEQAIRSTRGWTRCASAFGLWFGLLCPGILVAQNASPHAANQPVPSTPSPAAQSSVTPYSQNQVTFTQLAAPVARATTASSQRRRYNFPENECSADFWNSHSRESAPITQSPARVQQNPADLVDPADTVQQLPAEVADPVKRVQLLNSELAQPLPRVQQLDSEVVTPAERIENKPGVLAYTPPPNSPPDWSGLVD